MKKIPLFFLVFLLYPSLAFGLPIDVAGQTLDQNDVIYLLSRQMKVDTEVAALAWSEMDPSKKKEFISHISDVLILAEAGKLRGLAFNSEVQRQLKWDSINTLAKAYVDRVKMDWVVDQKTLDSFYRANLTRYTAPQKILARLGRSFLDGEPRWYSLNELPKEIRVALGENMVLGKLPPVLGSGGQTWNIEILEMNGSQVLPLDDVRERVLRDLRSSFLEKELARLRERFSSKIDIDTN
ncbi:hypothetical protein [Dethiosulfovibrio salsuginis]|uniref:PPIC-type PPIASE domain-containing protein n=1 Tax=Dethiosulfovibrio salsuginis TaxID=561720 RepID=A0A1X7KLS5_9BACT|nr:hypothetical protein [Dethiosulfovibrio salsuginis]SMG42288.1 hypothetical protein SAMN06275492_1314 [Dethiosulfovibrio salsuginis]